MGQQLNIRVMAYDWLHKGALICPSCKEMCGEEFESRGEHCKLNEEAPGANYFKRDDLKCSASHTNLNLMLVIFVLAFPFISR